MVYIPVPNTALAELIWSTASGISEITLGFKGDAAWTAATLEDLADALDSWESTNLNGLINSGATLTQIRCTSQESDSAPVYVKSVSLAGGHVNAIMPMNVTVTVTFRTALRGRSYRGRNYLPALSEDFCLADEVTSGYRTQALLAYGLLNTAVAGVNSAEHCVISRYHDKAPRAVGVATPVVSYAMEVTLDSQRRRLRGRGM